MADTPPKSKQVKERELRVQIANCAIQIVESHEYQNGQWPEEICSDLDQIVKDLKDLVLFEIEGAG